MDFSLELVGAFLALAALELILGIDNIIFITILASRVAKPQQRKARLLGLTLAMLMRVGLLFSISWLIALTAPLFTVAQIEISGRDLILGLGGLFLMWKATTEIQKTLEPENEEVSDNLIVPSLMSVLIQICLIDVVFSLDSVITAVGLVEHLPTMVAAIIVAVLIMMVASGPIAAFIEKNPSIKLLALAFLLLIGITLVVESVDIHVPKGYIYFAMAFSFGVQMLNLWASKVSQVQVHQSRLRRVVKKSSPGERIEVSR